MFFLTAGRKVICQSALLPLFPVAIFKHSMDLVRKAVRHLNAGKHQRIVTFDQPLYTIAKQIQLKWPEMYGEDKFFVMFGILHIKMAALRTLGDWLQSSGWVGTGTTAGTADSLRAPHVAPTRRAHQITAAALYILQYRAYNNRDTDTEDCLNTSTWQQSLALL